MTPTVIVVGGGIIGAVTAYSLAKDGVGVLLLDAGQFGRASTGKSAAIVRCHYSNPEVVRMAVHSRETFRRLPLLLECDPVYERTGWLFLVDEADAKVAVSNVEMQEEEGVDAIDVDDLQEYLPGVDEAGIAYALYEPDGGFADPVASTEAYVDRAPPRRGGEAREATRVESIEVERREGDAAYGWAASCSGAASSSSLPGRGRSALARTAGVELPLEITREQDVVFATGARADDPVRGLVADRPRLHAAGAGVRGGPPARRPGLPEGVRAGRPRRLRHRGRRRVRGGRSRADLRSDPRLGGMRPVDGRVGLYDVTPDWHPILGAVGRGREPRRSRRGGSGHCFKLGPAIGELVAASIVGRPSSTRVSRPSRSSGSPPAGSSSSTYGGNRA